MNTSRDRRSLAMLYILTASYFLIAIFGSAIGADMRSYIGALIVLCYVCSVVLLINYRILCLYYIQMLTFFVITYALQTSVGARYLGWMSGPSAITTEAALIFALHVISVTVAATLTAPQRRSVTMTRWRNSTMGLVLIFALLVIGLAVWVIGAEAYFGSRNEAAQTDFETWELGLEFFSKSLMYMVATAYILQFSSKKQGGIRYALVGIALCIALYVSNPVNTARFVSLSGACLVLLAVAEKAQAERAAIISVSVVPILLLAVLPVTSMMRSGIGNVEFALLSDMGASLEFSQMQLLLDALHYLDGRPLFSNYTITSFLIFVPRAVWPGKSFGLGPEVADYFGYLFSNAAVPSFLYFYADYGFGGLIFGSVAMGWIFAKLNLTFSDKIDFGSRRMMYGLLLFALIPIIARGDLTTSMIGVYAFAAAYEMVRFLGRLTIGRAGGRIALPTRLAAGQRMGPPLR